MKTQYLPSALSQELLSLYRQALAHGLSVDEVDKKVKIYAHRFLANKIVEEKEEQDRPTKVRRRLPWWLRAGSVILPVMFIGVGLYLLGSAVTPILSYYVSDQTAQEERELIAPIPRQQVLDITPLVVTAPVLEPEQEVVTLPTLELDYTNLANWFDEGQLPHLQPELNLEAPNGAVNQLSEYTVDIPALKIENALVKIGGTDLNGSLIAYQGTAMPGDFGAPVIFGHSVLRQFYNPSAKNPRRYTSIFSTIMTLKPGVDKIYITAGGVKYTYIVQSKTEVKPTDVYILTQQYDAKRLKLVTCVPEGTYLKRGVVLAQLVAE